MNEFNLRRVKVNALDNLGDIGDLVVAGIHRPLWWQFDSYFNRGGSDHLNLQPGLWTALISAVHRQAVLY